MDNQIVVGSKITGNWGTGIPKSHGVVTKVDEYDVYITWEDVEAGANEESIEDINDFNFEYDNKIGLYVRS